MSQTLGHEPVVHSPVTEVEVIYGRYNEVGAHSHLENVVYGDYSYNAPFCIFQNTRIGAFSNIAAGVRLGPTRHPMDRATQHHFTYRRAQYGFAAEDDEAFFRWRSEQLCFVGHDTWIGHGAIVMPGITVGTGAVVGAGSVVTRDVPNYAVVVGSPARKIKDRFPAPIQEALLEISWWNWEHEQIAAALPDFSAPVAEFVQKYRAPRKESK